VDAKVALRNACWLLVAAHVLTAAAIGHAQLSQDLQMAGQEFSFRLPASVRIERCHVDAALTTNTGVGLGWSRTGGRAGVSGRDLVIRTQALRGSGTQVALKASVWCPGFGMALVDVPSLDQANFQTTVTLTSRQDVPLAGRVLPPDDGVSLADSTLRVYYQADWLCGYFKQADCLVPQWEVETDRVASDGSFRVMVPDFAGDPAVGTDGPNRDKGAFWFRADRNQAPHNYDLIPDGDPCWAGRVEQPGSLPILPCRPGTLPIARDYRQVVLRARAH
jgi:hypothetical protein